MKFILDAKVLFCGNLQNYFGCFFAGKMKMYRATLYVKIPSRSNYGQISCIRQE